MGVAFLHAAALVDQHDADRRLGEEPLEALLGRAQRRFERAFAAEIVDHRPGAEAGAGIAGHHFLPDIGVERLAFGPAKSHFAAGHFAGEGAVRRRIRRHRRRQEILQIDSAGRHVGAGNAQPERQRRIDELEAAGLVDGIKSDGRPFHEVGEALLLPADQGFDLAPRRDVFDAPHHIAGQ